MHASKIEDKTSSFEELLEQDKSVLMHTRNMQILATEMITVYRTMPSIFRELFCRRDVISVIIYEAIPILQCQM